MAEKKFLDDNGLLYLWTKIKSAFVTKETGKGLSANDYTTTEKEKLSGIESGANKTTVENVLTSTSTTNALSAAQGQALKKAIDSITTDIGQMGGGDMMKATYDADGDGVIDSAANASNLGGQSPEYYAAASDIPENVSELENDAGYITGDAITNKADKATTLSGYGISDAYTAAQTDNKIAEAVANAGHLKREIVAALPDVSKANEHTIYMVLDSEGGDDNKYVEYMLVNGAFERTGSSDVDLSGYLQTSDVVSITNSEIDTIVAS